MNARQLRIQILDLQDQHCHFCQFQFSSYKYCYFNCPVGERIQQWGLQLSSILKKKKGMIDWDVLCKKALELKDTHKTYKAIATVLGCDVSGLRKQLKKRGLQFYSQKTS